MWWFGCRQRRVKPNEIHYRDLQTIVRRCGVSQDILIAVAVGVASIIPVLCLLVYLLVSTRAKDVKPSEKEKPAPDTRKVAPGDRSVYSVTVKVSDILKGDGQCNVGNEHWNVVLSNCTFPERTEIKMEFRVRKDDEATCQLVGDE